MREYNFAVLAVVNRAAVEIAADCHADYHGCAEAVVGAPADGHQLVADLHHGGPDVIEKLDLGNRLQSALGHPDGAPDDGGFRYGAVETTLIAALGLQPVRGL